ncbi:MAG: fumarate hydratase C-terminal domain-containing protein [Eubacteriales bacterium]|nr:fumarate hydratase C-terminal domain-containing protein [Eubacteriales bacterium]
MTNHINTPTSEEAAVQLQTGDMVYITGRIYCGRDAVLPKICKLIEEGKLGETGIDLQGSVIFHTAVSPAGVGPTSSNKLEIEGSFETLSKAGVKMHLGKGAIKAETVAMLDSVNAVFAVMPPVTALLGNNTLSSRCVAFPGLGMEAFYELEVKDYPCIIAAAHGKSIY